MKGSLPQLLFLTVIVGLSSWVGVKWFVADTDELAQTIDVRSMAHLRESDNTSKPVEAQSVAAASKVIDVSTQRVRKPPSEQSAQVDQDPARLEEGTDKESEVEEKAESEEQSETSTDSDRDSEVELQERPDGNDEEKRTQGDSAAQLDKEEVRTREAARRQRLAELGLVPAKRQDPTIAVDVSLELPSQCSGAAIARVPAGLKFRYESSLIKGESLNILESLVAFYRECPTGQFILAHNPLGREDATETLKQMRIDEVKYFFIQHSVSLDAVQFPEDNP